ncbi:MAG: hypothetical protein AAFU56_11590, partial [Pseudomonadota bacterium]
AYQQPGDRYNVPDTRPGLHVEAWGQAARQLRDLHIQVVNANAESAVGFFPFGRLSDMLADGSDLAPPREEPPAKDDWNSRRAPGLLLERLAQERSKLAVGVLLSVSVPFSAVALPDPLGVVVALVMSATLWLGLCAAFLLFRRSVADKLSWVEAALAASRPPEKP